MVNRVGNAEKRIGALEDKHIAHQEVIQDFTNEIKHSPTWNHSAEETTSLSWAWMKAYWRPVILAKS